MMGSYGKDANYWLKKWFLSPAFKEALDIIPEDSTILDLGCGGGRLGLYLASRGITTWGLDSDPTLIRNLQEQYPTMHWICGDAEQPDIWKNLPEFDWIVSNVCIRKDQCQLTALIPYFTGASLLLRIQGSKDLGGYVKDTPCYSVAEILQILPECEMEIEHYSQKFTSGDYLRSSIQKIGMQPKNETRGQTSLSVPREYLLVQKSL